MPETGERLFFMEDHRLQNLAEQYRKMLLDDCVPFWFPRAVDNEWGGYLHCLDRDGTLLDSDKSVWAQGRMAWLLLTMYNQVEKRTQWLTWAESGIHFLEKHCVDQDGRFFFHVTREGLPIRKRRYAFSEAFAAIAQAAYARATGSDRAAERAIDLFERFVFLNFTPGAVAAKFTDTRPLTGLASRMITLVTARELTKNLGEQPGLNGWMDRVIGEIISLFVKPEERCVLESVAPDGSISDHFDGRMLNPGHAIEAAWFIMEEGRIRKDKALVEEGCRMLDWMWQRGWDQEYGGLYYFRDLYNRPVQEYWHDMKFWWPHNEALIATLLAWRLTGEESYAEKHLQLLDWCLEHFADPEHGEWYGYLHRDGTVSVPLKGNLWKSFFHHPRCLWKCWNLCRENISV